MSFKVNINSVGSLNFNTRKTIEKDSRVKSFGLNYSMTIAGHHGHIAPIRGNPCCRKLDKETYLDLRDGEIKKFNITETRDIANLFSARQKLLDLVHTNSRSNSEFITITSQENCQDRNRWLYYMKHFSQTKIFQEVFGREYLYTIERQKRGALHSHIICFNPAMKRIPYKELINAWRKVLGGLGSVCCKRIDNPMNVGKYLAKYILKDFEEVGKYKRCYIPSKGLSQPEKKIISEKEFLKLLPNLKVKKRKIEGEEMVVGYYW